MSTIGIIIGSTRPVRIGPQLAEQVADHVRAASPDTTVEIIDLREVDLPFLDEPQMPMLGNYQHQHTKDWGRRIAALDGVVLLTPQYNGGIPAPLKNAVDTIYAEWNDLPTLVVSYGGRGGQMAADAFKNVFLITKADAVADNVAITVPQDGYGDDGRLVDPAGVVGAHAADLDRGIGELLAKVDAHGSQPPRRG